MSVPSDDSLSEVLIDDLRLAWTANYGTVAAFTVLVYDIILTSGREITYIWRAKWSFPKIVYLFIRYYGLANLAFTVFVLTRTSNSPQTCRHYFFLLTFGGPLVFTTLSNVILMLRVHALYNRSRGVLIILILLLAGQFTAVLYSGIRTSSSFVVSRIPGVPWPGCIMTTFYVPGILIGWIPDVITSTILFLLTMWNLIRSVLPTRGWRATFQRNQPYAARRIPPLFTTFFRDGTVHYFILMVSATTLVVITMAAPAPLGSLVVPWMITSYSFATSRLILNLRVAAAHLQGSTTTWHQTFSIRMPNMATYSDESTESDQRVGAIEENPIELHSFA